MPITAGEDVVASGVGAALVTVTAVPLTKTWWKRHRERQAQRAYDRGVEGIEGVTSTIVSGRERTAILEREMKGVKNRLEKVEAATNETNALVRSLVGGDGNGNSLASILERLARQGGVWHDGPQKMNRRRDDS